MKTQITETAFRTWRTFLVGLAITLVTAAPAVSDVSDTKRQTILDLIEATGGADMMDEMMQTMHQGFQQNGMLMMEELIRSDPNLSEEERATVRQHFKEQESVAGDFAEFMQEIVDTKELINEVFIPLYDTHYSEQELNDILAFYKTPTGQKTIKIMPTILRDSMQRTMAILQPKLKEALDKVFKKHKDLALPAT